MNARTSQYRLSNDIHWIVLFIALIWGVFVLDLFFPLERMGLIPRDFGGLIGVASMPFLHANWQHLISNSIPLLVLLVLLAGSRAHSISIVVGICVIGGLILWVIGRPALHIGASLLVFGLASFLVVSGLMEKRPLSLLISAMIILIYGGSLVKGIFPFSPGVSWEGHASGLLAGGICAAVYLNPSKVNNRNT